MGAHWGNEQKACRGVAIGDEREAGRPGPHRDRGGESAGRGARVGGRRNLPAPMHQIGEKNSQAGPGLHRGRGGELSSSFLPNFRPCKIKAKF